MGLDVPDLDDRTFEDLLEQATKLIPAYTDSWTDFNAHDPGITILEVLAWLTETHIYQLDQVTDEHREKYLRLLGHERRLPQSATARVQIGSSPDRELPSALLGTRFPRGTALTATDGVDDDTYRFETDHDVVLTDATVDRVVTVGDGGVTDNTEANRSDGMYFRPFGDRVQRGDACYLGFDGDPFAHADAATLTATYHHDDLPEPNPPMGDDGDVEFVPSVALEWAYRDPQTQAWEPLAIAADGTTCLYESGQIELERRHEEGAADRPHQDLPIGGETDDHVWLRCRVETAGYEIPPQLERVGTNVVAVGHRATIRGERLQLVSSPTADQPAHLDGQTYEFDHGSIRSATITVDGEPFHEVSDFDASGPDDPHYRLDREAGRVTFGDGIAGRVPPVDATVTADYVHGGGDAGNVSAKAAWRLLDGSDRAGADAHDVSPAAVDVGVEGLGAATGGTDGETVEEAFRRARRDLRRPYRAVTESDYRYLAKRTPGVRLARTTVHVEDDRVTVVVVPYAPPDVPDPRPSEGFLRAVRRHLEGRTILTDRLRVCGPTYVRLEVAVDARTRPRYSHDGHETAVRDAVESHLHPLAGGDGDGWPFGRAVTTGELASAIEAVDAIDRVTDVSITAHGGTTLDEETVAIDETALFAVESVAVNLSATPTAGGRGGAGGRHGDGGGVR